MKRNTIIRHLTTAAIVVAAAAATGCFKKVSHETRLVIKPLVQEVSAGSMQAVAGAKAYAFGVDTTLWTVATYADAEAGIITPKTGGEPSPAPIGVSEPFVMDSTENWVVMTVNAPTAMLVVVDTAHRLYGYCQYKFAENLPSTYLSVIFRPWRAGNFYVDGAWRMFNEFYTEPEPEDPDSGEPATDATAERR